MSVERLLEQAREREVAGDVSAAVTVGEAAVACQRSAGTLLELARLLIGAARWKEAEAVAREASALNPSGAGAYFALGVALEAQGEYLNALSAFESGLGIEDLSSARVIVAQLCRRLGLRDRAVREFEQVLKRDPTDTEALYGLAFTIRTSDPIRAEEFLREVLRIDPAEKSALRELGYVLWRQSKSAAAELSLRSAIDHSPDDAWSHNYLSSVLLSLDRPAESELSARTAIGILPEEPLFHCDLGDALFAQERWVEAEQAYLAALALDIGHFAANLHFGRLLEKRGHLSRALNYYERALASRPVSSQARVSIERLRAGAPPVSD